MAAIDFTIKGLGVGYYKDGTEVWTVTFPTDENHKVEFSYKKGGNASGSIYLADKSIKFSSTNSVAPEKYEDESFIENVMDLTADYLHPEGLSKREIFLKGVREISFDIPHAKLFSLELRQGRLNYVFPFDDPGNIHLITDKENSSKPQLFSMLVGGKISILEGGKVTITIEGEEPIDLLAGDSFHIDNDCYGETIRNDFQLYQDIFVNIKFPEKRYEMISIIDPNLLDEPVSKASGKLDPNLTIRMFTSPPPLVCDFVRVSKPNKLA